MYKRGKEIKEYLEDMNNIFDFKHIPKECCFDFE